MTRCDYCDNCEEMVGDSDPCCTTCGKSICYDCLEDGKRKTCLTKEREYWTKIHLRNEYIEQERKKLGYCDMSEEGRALFDKYQYTTEFFSKEDEDKWNEIDKYNLEDEDEDDEYTCLKCIEDTCIQIEMDKLKNELNNLKSENDELKEAIKILQGCST